MASSDHYFAVHAGSSPARWSLARPEAINVLDEVITLMRSYDALELPIEVVAPSSKGISDLADGLCQVGDSSSTLGDVGTA